jgi:uncharacterized membrane protein
MGVGLMFVLAAAYDDVASALADYDSIVAAYRHVGSSRHFDATVVARQPGGDIEIVKRHDEPLRRSTESGAGWGLAAGAVVALFPAVGIIGALAVGGGAGAVLGRLAGRTASVLSRDDLKRLGEVLDRGEAGLVVVYTPEMADRVTTSTTRANGVVHTTTDVPLEAVADELHAAQN